MIWIARFKNGKHTGVSQTDKTLTEMQAIKTGEDCVEITQSQYDQIKDGWAASESGGVVTVTEPAEWLENKTNEAWRKIRKERNQLLKDSDYIMVSDAPITAEKKEEWTTYRQSLRDIPQTFSNPDDVTYPDKPE